MKTIQILILLFLVNVSGFAEDKKYREAMLSSITLLNNARGNEDFTECASRFERIALAEKDQWLPYYYASYSLICLSYDEPENSRKDLILDKAQQLLDIAFTLSPDESELHTLQAFLYPSRIIVDPMSRGMEYMEKLFLSLERAKTSNPENPRIYFLMGVTKLNLPPAMGGGPEVALPLFIEAKEKFVSFKTADPLMPGWGEEANRKELEKLSGQPE